MRLHGHPCGLGAHWPRVTKELDRVAVTVKATYEHAFTCKRCAIPQPVRVGLTTAGDAVAFAPRLLETAGQHLAGPTGSGAEIRVVPLARCVTNVAKGARDVSPGQGFSRQEV